jgi:hypothetical protein
LGRYLGYKVYVKLFIKVDKSFIKEISANKESREVRGKIIRKTLLWSLAKRG